MQAILGHAMCWHWRSGVDSFVLLLSLAFDMVIDYCYQVRSLRINRRGHVLSPSLGSLFTAQRKDLTEAYTYDVDPHAAHS